MCFHLFLPQCHRPSPGKRGSASRVCPTNHDFSQGSFRGCRYFLMFRPPSLLAPQIVPTAAILPQGSRGFYIRAYRVLLPPHAPDMLTVRTQVIDSTGTFTLPDLQPCRLLTPFLALSFASVTLSRPCHVSSPRHVERSMRISRTTLSCLLHSKVYGTYLAGATFGPDCRTR